MAAPRPPPPRGWHYEKSDGSIRLVRNSGLGKTPLSVPVVELDPHTGCETCAEAERLLQRLGATTPWD